MFIAQKDNNTGLVYKWTKVSDGVTESYYVPESDWKLEKEWTKEQVESLFKVKEPVQVEPIEEEPVVLVEEEPLNLNQDSETDF